jgi:hypothetical protein
MLMVAAIEFAILERDLPWIDGTRGDHFFRSSLAVSISALITWLHAKRSINSFDELTPLTSETYAWHVTRNGEPRVS